MNTDETSAAQATDPVCGMTVDITSASLAGLTSEHKGQPYYFCGRGCKLEFHDDPDRYLDQSYRPSM
jgi:YHS domain-containing protein